MSIRRLMLVSLIGTMTLVMCVAGWFSFRAGLQEAGEMFDAKLAHSARVLVSLVDQPLDDLTAHGPTEPITINVWHGAAEGVGDALAFPTGHAYETKLAFQVRDDEGTLLLRSDSGPDSPIAPLEPGYRDVRIDGEQWRTFTLKAPSGRWFQAGEVSDIREELAGDIAFGTLLPLLVALPLMMVLVWLIVTWALRDLLSVTRQIEQRSPENLTPLVGDRIPREVRGVVHAVDALMSRLDAALKRERRFTADAAHELRTPIAALKVHADNLMTSRDAIERSESQDMLQRSVARVERLVSQMLSLSRAEESAGLRTSVPVDLDEVVRQQVSEYKGTAGKRGIGLELRSAPARVVGDPVALEAMVRNLIDNAVRYAPDGGWVRVSLADEPRVTRLDVEDSGPGIPEEARERVFNRFHRELGTGVEGNGLGLAIVKNVLALHGGRVWLSTSADLGGLHVVAEIPR